MTANEHPCLVSDEAAQVFVVMARNNRPMMTAELQDLEPLATFDALTELASARLISFRHSYGHDLSPDLWFGMVEVDNLERLPPDVVHAVWLRGGELLGRFAYLS